MTSKRISGYVFIILAAILSLTIVVQLPTLLGLVFGFFKIFPGKVDSFKTGYVIGQFIYWICHFAVTIALWKYGVRWAKKEVKE